MKVAVYSIALNEAKHVKRWVKACAGADVLVVADTGSTDGTQSLLRDAGVQVHEISIQPWRFDSARNTALNLVPSDVDICVSVDLDEIPEPDFFKKLRRQWKEESNRGWIYMDTGTLWVSDRIHARHGFQWKYPIHEVTAPSMGTEVVSCATDAVIVHRPDNSKSRAQYLTMLEQAVQEDPKEQRMLVYLVREYGFHKRWQDVVDTVKKLNRSGWDVERAAACRNAGDAYTHLGKPEEALGWYESAVEVLPSEPESFCALAQYHYFQKNWEECYAASLGGLKTLPSNHYLTQPNSMFQLNDFASLSAWELGLKKEAVKHAHAALSITRDQRILDNLAFYKKNLGNA
jgi:glycosyltransferase involved in cell wall biosynthesis